jgi:uncharacterized membrane protein YvbJ
MKCTKCSKEFASEFQFCPHCGSSVSDKTSEKVDHSAETAKTVKQIYNFLVMLVAGALILYFVNNIIKAHMEENRINKKYEHLNK